ncbi:ketopantoate reductase family protein [Hydrogenophaga sp.]|uniref:ketopantoate reductase family protein n=1 Tax=Hydrogenophaga sp. TaxID=1904254 RepID=UPI002725607B|nr:2-dehydropantoate 2-reductase [Hydrogenophaga sp.]MDO9436903.1 2-dehydropantoate 2-reductase [Hydrogenophaga sp.]
MQQEPHPHQDPTSARIVMLGGGAVGGYVGGYLSDAGYDVTLVDFWHDHIEAIRKNGLQLTGLTAEEAQVFHPKTLHMHEIAKLRRAGPVDIAFVSMKSYDTAWATTMIKPYLAPGGYVVSLQNCINEETIADIVGWGKTIGCIASRISVELFEPGKIRRQAPKGAAEHTVFRVGEVHGRETERVRQLARMLGIVDGTRITSNLWGERWSKLCHNAMRNGIAAATGLAGREIDQHDHIRELTLQLGGEAVAIGQALGFELEKIGKLTPELILKAAGGEASALAKANEILVGESGDGGRGALQRPSMGQDMVKGRRTEIEEINGFIVRKGEAVGMAAPNNARLVDLVLRVERGELKPDPANIPTAWASQIKAAA